MSHTEKVIMKCPQYKVAKNMEKSLAAAAAKLPSPVKEPSPVKPACPPSNVTTVLFSLNDNTRAVNDKENSTSRDHDGTLDECFEDSGYLSLHNSQIDDHHEDEHMPPPLPAVKRQEKTISPKNSPYKCHQAAATPPVGRRTVAYTLSSTPSSDHHSNLPILKFQQAVCEELAKSYQKNKRYDWSIVSKVAEKHLLDRVAGGHMGEEYIDIFESLLARNMKSILSNILRLLGDMDLISCKKVSRTWRDIICNDTAALGRCQKAEETLRESRNSLRQRASGLTRDVAVSRVVLSCMQTLASSNNPSHSSSSSSAPSCRVNKRASPSQKSGTPGCTRFNNYMQAAGSLKQHESLRPCKRCGSPATHSAEVQKATCSRPSCLFVSCTRCREAFHGSTPCRVVQPRSYFPSTKSTPVLPGSARSKMRIKRL